ncbi:MAG: 5-formyltetrahydrofolate cyclo-ligase [Candidatus Tokpelaia sp. JSC189]|nr:MAG: 5-formyltetrahydrofolate cyclo-ligase [Candidatus Tokpelaia sp. JSC189]
MKNRKNELRHQALARRSRLREAERRSASEALIAGAVGLFPETETISAFWPVGSEIDPRPLMTTLEKQGNRLALPAIIGKGIIIFRRFDMGNPLVDMACGTKGPPADADTVDPTTILLPLAAFDARGNRIGYGGGYYDRVIGQMRIRGLKLRLIGLAFDCQQVKNIPVKLHDVSMESILTESGFRVFCW